MCDGAFTVVSKMLFGSDYRLNRTVTPISWFAVTAYDASNDAETPLRFTGEPWRNYAGFHRFPYRFPSLLKATADHDSLLEAAMRLPLAALFTLFVSSICATALSCDSLPQDRLTAARKFEQAKDDLRNYWLVEYPRQLREFDAAIEIAAKELEYNKALRHEYRAFNRFSTGNPFPITQRDVELCARTSELRLDNLRTERNNLVRFHADHIRALTVRAYQARDRLQAIDAAIAASISTDQLPLPKLQP